MSYVINRKMIQKEMRLEGEFLRAVSPFGHEWALRLVSAACAVFFDLFSLKGLGCEKQTIQRPDGSDMKVCVFQGKGTCGPRVGILWLHGGGYVLGAPEMVGMSFPLHLLKECNCVVVAPDYTLSAKKPFPAAIDDCYTALNWMDEHAAELGIETSTYMVGGESAGGGLTASLCLYERDRARAGGRASRIGLQMPLYPMADDRPTATNIGNDAPVWDTAANQAAWKIYLGPLHGSEVVPYYAAPARATDYTDLPPAISIVGTIEPFYAETLELFRQLDAAGVDTALREYDGCYHAFDMMAPYASPSKAATRFLLNAYRDFAEKVF